MASPPRSSKASEPRAPNPNDPKISKAFNAMKCLGISPEVVKPVLKHLFKLYGGNWELIEEDNYRTLADAIFESFEDKKKSKAVMVPDEEKYPLKRSHPLNSEDQPSSARGNGNKTMESNSDSNRKTNISNAEGSSVDTRLPAQRVSSSSHATGIQRKRHQSNDSSDEDTKPIANSTDKKRLIQKINDITRGTEKLKISLVDEIGIALPKFRYIAQNTTYQDAYVPFTLARIADENCCFRCTGDCLSSRIPCACSRETGGEFAYTSQGLLKDEFLEACISMYNEPQDRHFFYCQDCPIERAKNVQSPEPCKGHVMSKFIKECWRKCGCNMECGNRVVQRGITCKLQVFAMEGKGWGVRTLEYLPKGSFVCEYIGEILTNNELYERNKQTRLNERRHTYPVTLDSDWGSEQVLKDEEALCLDATNYGNVGRFINHRCSDSNLIYIPVEVETPDHHYYHIAYFTKRNVEAYEELTWDYQIDFEDDGHPIKAFKCQCGSSLCRDGRREAVGTKKKDAGVKRCKSGTNGVN